MKRFARLLVMLAVFAFSVPAAAQDDAAPEEKKEEKSNLSSVQKQQVKLRHDALKEKLGEITLSSESRGSTKLALIASAKLREKLEELMEEGDLLPKHGNDAIAAAKALEDTLQKFVGLLKSGELRDMEDLMPTFEEQQKMLDEAIAEFMKD
jgi:hypothetical protein